MQNKPGISYLDGNAVRRMERRTKRRTVSGGCLTVFFLLSTVMALANYSPEIRRGLLVYVGLLISSVLLLLLGLRDGRDLSLVCRYNDIFCGDQDGVVHLSELTETTGKQAGQLLGELERLFRLGVFQGCTLRQGSNPAVLLANAGANENGFIMVTCPQCGASSRIRAGTSGRCDYCGGALRG